MAVSAEEMLWFCETLQGWKRVTKILHATEQRWSTLGIELYAAVYSLKKRARCLMGIQLLSTEKEHLKESLKAENKTVQNGLSKIAKKEKEYEDLFKKHEEVSERNEIDMVCLEESLNAEIRELHKKNEDLEEEHREELGYLNRKHSEVIEHNEELKLEKEHAIFWYVPAKLYYFL